MSSIARDTFPMVSAHEVDRWDREWMHYFSTESRYQHLVEYQDLEVTADLSKLKAPEVFDTALTTAKDGANIVPLHIWVDGGLLVGKKVVEIGCGCGLLGKQVGLVASEYLGVDYSPFALAVARGVSPSNCTYIHVSRYDKLMEFEGCFDTMVGREFFIHQNFENARWVLRMGAFLIKRGGVISADFYESDPNVEQGIVHPSKAPVDPVYASCAFQFTRPEIDELADTCGLAVRDVTDYRPYQRRFVTFCRL